MKNDPRMNPDTVIVHMGDMKAVFTGNNLFAFKSANLSQSHFHIDFEFQYVAQGELSLVLNEGRQMTLRAGDCALILPNVSHVTAGEAPISRFSFNFTLCRAKSEEDGCDYSEFEYYLTRLSKIGDAVLLRDRRITECVEEISILSGSAPDRHRAKLAFGTLLSRIGVLLDSSSPVCAGNVHQPDSISDESARRRWITESFISLYYTDPEPLRRLSLMLNLSERQTARCVMALTGRPIGQLILKQRMDAAKSLILKTQLGFTEVACWVGYESYPGFFSAFRQFYGMSPSEFKSYQSKTV